jgi:5-methylcytosine-specific restriction protein A
VYNPRLPQLEGYRLCAQPNCPEVIAKPSRYCPEHAKGRGWEQWRNSERGRSRQSGYSSPRWRRMRDERMRFAGHCCELREPGCTGTATQVHHLDHAAPSDPSFYAWDNLRATCEHCHRRRSHERLRGVKATERRSATSETESRSTPLRRR